MAEEPPGDENPPDGEETPWAEPPANEQPPARDSSSSAEDEPSDGDDEPSSAEDEPSDGDDEPSSAEGEPSDGEDEPLGEVPPLWQGELPPQTRSQGAGEGSLEDSEPAAERDAEGEANPQDAEDHPPMPDAGDGAPPWDDEHPTSEQLLHEAGEEPVGAAPRGTGEDPPDHAEPPWGSGPPPWERGGFWGDEAEESALGDATIDGEGPPLLAADLTTRRARQRAERRRAGHRRLLALLAALVILIVIIVVATSGGGGPLTPPSTTGSAFAHSGSGPSHLFVHTDTGVLTENLLIADRNNNRLLAITPLGQSVKSVRQEAPSDAYLSKTGRTVYVTQHAQSVVVVRLVNSGRVSYTYGHPGKVGSKPDYLHDPGAAQETANADVVVADRGNCRVLFLNPALGFKQPVNVWGSPGTCTHHVTSLPLDFAYPDAAFATSNGDIVVTETNPAWVDILSKAGSLVSAVQLPFGAPSDANEYAPNNVIVSDRTHPGKVVEFDFSSSSTTVTPTWTYDPSSGSGELDRPTFATVLPNGDVLVADSGNDRVIVIDHATKKIVWQYGHTHVPGRSPGYLHTPDSVTLVPNAPAS